MPETLLRLGSSLYKHGLVTVKISFPHKEQKEYFEMTSKRALWRKGALVIHAAVGEELCSSREEVKVDGLLKISPQMYHDIKGKVGGSIRISNIEETVTESRKVSNAKEESAIEKTSRRRAVKIPVFWKAFKNIFFVICLIFLIIQSVEFFNVYYKYPTTIVKEVTVAKEFKLPAITFCFRTT
ncbi:hypothetical protein AVEN_271255-1 [Araneus ventricosus]|uniref:Uncharacterized protein n=1 Tax=Araneus ventricosus TaxID=182803 RepID=A0A4Y2G0D8_ARAVE|nr:hypothetical protein AVEN_271255-1 [Araneus ventricosus]